MLKKLFEITLLFNLLNESYINIKKKKKQKEGEEEPNLHIQKQDVMVREDDTAERCLEAKPFAT